MRARTLRRVGAVTTMLGLATTVLGSVAAVAAGAGGAGAAAATVTATGTTSSSAVTIDWASLPGHDESSPSYEALKRLQVSVDQTEDITNQGLTITWSGGRPTPEGTFGHDFLQIMQCWGDAPDGPTPQQCQWGAPASGLSGLLGDRTAGRTLSRGEDPRQAYDKDFLVPPPRTNPNLKAYAVPFRTVDGDSVIDFSPYFTSTTTNEITAARTGADGTGIAVFTTQTALEAPQLGCGGVTSSGSTRDCWLVIVPRGDTLADGTPASQTPDGLVSGSPLSATSWADRIVVPLSFQRIGTSCALGQPERRIVGHEVFTEAMTSWQAQLCSTGTTYGFSQIGDAEARTQIVSSVDGASRMGVVSRPLTSEQAGSHPVLYTPVARSALVVAFNIDRDYQLSSERMDRNGTPVEQLTLDARLVAKLLTQSYRSDVPGGGSGKPLADNPRSIVTDPEFVELNPEFEDFVATAGPQGLLVSLGSSDAVAEVWAWLRADPYAAAFLAGKPDEWGMRINPAYLSLGLATDTTTDSFPKADLSTYRQSTVVPEPGYGTLDLLPYMNDMREAAYRTQRGDSGAKVVWDPYKLPPAFTSSGAQLPGHRFEMSITTLVSAQRYGLRTAALVNQAGETVAATAASVTAGIDAMPASGDAPGVTVYDGGARSLGAYPLSTLSYAAVSVCQADTDERQDYARFLRYAVTTGQVQGTAKGRLLPGYLPLTAAEVASGKALASTLTSTTKVAALCPAPKPVSTPAPTSPGPSETPTPSDAPAGPAPSGTPPTPAPTAAATPPAAPAPPSAPQGVLEPEATAVDPVVTARADLGPARLGLVGALGLGLPGTLLGPVLLRRAAVLEARDADAAP